MFTNNQSVDIFSSRDEIRSQLIDYAKKYMGLENVDLYKTSFVSYIIDMLSILSTNQMFYSSTVYKESFFLQAQLLESVYNLAHWIGYNPEGAEAAQVQALLTIPLSFSAQEVNLVIPEDFTIRSNNIIFKLDSTYSFGANTSEIASEINDMKQHGVNIRILQNRVVTVQDSNGFFYPVQLTIVSGSDIEARFLLPFTQIYSSFLSFQIPDDLEFYQFYSKRLTGIEDQVATQDIYVIPPDAVLPPTIKITDIDTLDKFNQYLTPEQRVQYKWERSEAGIYTLTSSEQQYGWTSYQGQTDILFGNGILGKQPDKGSMVFVVIYLTKGEAGNVIAGSITSGDPILYTDGNNRVSRISYNVINPSSAYGGKDSQTIEEVKKNAITNLKARERVVSDSDYTDFNIIVKDTPLEESTPILKRSDLKINEFLLFSELIEDDTAGIAQIIPTRNIVMVPDSTSVLYPEFYIPRGTVPQNPDDTQVSLFQTLFSLNVDLLTNSVGYEYLLKSASVSTILQSSDSNYNSKAYIIIPTVDFSATVNPTDPDPVTISVNATVNHIPTTAIAQFRCKIITPYNGETHLMTTEISPNDPLLITEFSYNFINILDFPMKNVIFDFSIEGYIPYQYITDSDKAAMGWGPNEEITKPSAWLQLSVYSCSLIIRKDLSDYMMSSIDSYTDDHGVLKYRIHNVPVILTEYINLPTFDSNSFELTVLQKLISNIQINKYRMLNDFINLKFPDTTGLLDNMKYNPIDDHKIISKRLTSIPINPAFGDSYIVNGSEGYDLGGDNWNKYINYIARWNGAKWIFIQPTTNEFIEIDDTYDPNDPDQGKRLIYSGSAWIEPVFNIPLTISLKIEQDPSVATSSTALVSNIRSVLVDTLSANFGLDKNIDRSQIIQTVRAIAGVKYVELLEPQVDIRFNYDSQDLTEEELLDYTPQLVCFTEDTIAIKIVS